MIFEFESKFPLWDFFKEIAARDLGLVFLMNRHHVDSKSYPKSFSNSADKFAEIFEKERETAVYTSVAALIKYYNPIRYYFCFAFKQFMGLYVYQYIFF